MPGMTRRLGDWHDLGTLERIAAAVRAGDLDPVDLTSRALRRAAESADLNAVVHLDAEGAMAAAADHDRRGPLAGIPVLVKEIVEVEGWPFRCGSASFEDRVGVRDAEIVRRLRAAGAVLVGLSHSHEFAYGPTGTSNRIGPCRNPHDPDRMTGGSSAGAAAAVAAGVVPLAIGTDTAGSVRIPAALCGVVGAKPAGSTLPTCGVFPLSQTLDTVGVLTRSVADAAYALEVLSEQSLSAAATGVFGVAVNPECEPFEPEVGRAWSAALDRLLAAGARLEDVALPDWATMAATATGLQAPEAVAIHQGRDMSAYQPDVRERLRAAAEVPAWRYVKARAAAVELGATVSDLLADLDAVLSPTVPIVAPPLDATHVGTVQVRDHLLRITRPANLTGHPAWSVPVPAAGLPVGLQILATDNARAAAAARWIEQALTV
jgi:Asp-tRNA(Asn)/Glu-tRNA(Gln) amidotransferase A subunit family amidase